MDTDFENIISVLEEGGRQMVEVMQDNLIENDSLGSGKLARSIIDKLEYDNNGNPDLQIWMEQYGYYVDQGIGRRPGKQPPVQPLINWLKQKKVKVPAGMSVASYAFLIARKIGRDGTHPKPKPFIQKSIDFVMNNYLTKALQVAGGKDIENSMNLVFTKNGAKVT